MSRYRRDQHRNAVPGHVRRTRLRSIRVRLLLPIIVAMGGLGVLGVGQPRAAMDVADDAQRSQQIAGALSTTVKLAHQVEEEIAETADLLLRGGKGEQLLSAQRLRTDAAV